MQKIIQIKMNKILEHIFLKGRHTNDQQVCEKMLIITNQDKKQSPNPQ
jgi:hypothetical protein